MNILKSDYTLRSICVSFLFLLFSLSAYSRIIEDTVANYIVKITSNKNGQQLQVSDLNGKKIHSKYFYKPLIYFYDLDGDRFDEAVVVDSVPQFNNFNYSIYVYSFTPKFEFCDSLETGKIFPEFYDFNSDLGYFIKVYDHRFENIFGSALKILPIQFYTLVDKTLLLDNDFSYEEYESELDNLLNLLDETKRGFDCNDLEAKKDIQKIIAVIYADLIYMNSHFSIENFVKQNYPCTDANEFFKVLKHLFQ